MMLSFSISTMKNLVIVLLSLGCGRSNFELADSAPTTNPLDAAQDRANIAFVTSTTHSGNFGGPAAADAICASRANAAGLDGTFVAMVKSPTRPDPVSLLANSAGWKSTGGLWIAETLQQVRSRQFFHPLNQRENQILIGLDEYTAWVGGDVSNDSCFDWTDAQRQLQIQYARIDQWGLNDRFKGFCDSQHHIACFETGHQGVRKIEVSDKPLVFVSTAVWKPNPAGRAAADQLCQLEATTAGAMGVFLALLPNQGETAMSRFPRGASSLYQRSDGELVGSLAALTSFLMLDAGGKPSTGSTWTGGDPNQISTATCASWQDPDPGKLGKSGTAGFFGTFGFDDFQPNCDQAFHLYCAQQ
jgi:hypothetical protein